VEKGAPAWWFHFDAKVHSGHDPEPDLFGTNSLALNRPHRDSFKKITEFPLDLPYSALVFSRPRNSPDAKPRVMQIVAMQLPLVHLRARFFMGSISPRLKMSVTCVA
jgi:hypothetical protein